MRCCGELFTDGLPLACFLSAMKLEDGEGGVGKQGVEGSEVFASFH